MQYWNSATVNGITFTTVYMQLKSWDSKSPSHNKKRERDREESNNLVFLSACLDLYPLESEYLSPCQFWEVWHVKACPAGAVVTKGRWLPGQPCVCGQCQAGATPWPNKAGAMAGYDLKTERKGQTDWPSSSRAQWGTYSTDRLLMD